MTNMGLIFCFENTNNGFQEKGVSIFVLFCFYGFVPAFCFIVFVFIVSDFTSL